ncbi:hypothetical protein HPB48_020236 [Haemaphysalis longicornis]|uniref:Sulfatase N-terminal domain-containing protein n=1 Tax=Haemaphysalis longicornis TaxID=44386 RepID=A0A9J6FCU5_HAELO|nr:hypothetical protein HPB48_020236 [Haemaphysalis longicornis]
MARGARSSLKLAHAGMVSALDESVGLVFEALSKKGMLRDTLFVFASDNGGDPASPQANYASSWPLKSQKYTPWEGGGPIVRRAVELGPCRGAEEARTTSTSSMSPTGCPTLYQMAGQLDRATTPRPSLARKALPW